jgi:hypothetical protein
MTTKEQNILEKVKGMSRIELASMYLEYKARFQMEKREAEWLNQLASDLRYDDEESITSEEMYNDYSYFKRMTKETYRKVFGIDL